MLTQLPKTARDVLATHAGDGGVARMLEIAILRLLEIGKDFVIADDLAVPFYGGVIHSRRRYFLLSQAAYVGFVTEGDEYFVVDVNATQHIGVRREESVRSFCVEIASESSKDRNWIYDVPIMPLPTLVGRLLWRGSIHAMAAVVTLIRAQGLDETFAEQLNDARHPAYLDCLNEVRRDAAYDRD